MNDILFVFLSLSLSGSILALILLAIKPFVKNKLSQTWQYYIWLVVILRFLLPFTPQASIVGEMARQLQGIINPSIVSEENSNYGANDDYTVPGVDENPSLSASQDTEPETPVKTQGGIPARNEISKPLLYWRDVLENIWLLWAAVALVLFVHKAESYRSFVRFINVGKKKIIDTNMLGIYADELSAARIKRQLPLFVNEQVVSPMLVGFLRPSLVLPVLYISDDEMRQIFRHELTHFKRLDFLYKWIVQITLCMHWFNPLIYLINKQINKSCEMSCDESVIKHLDEDGRITYGDALMASLTAQGKYGNFVVSITMSENVTIVKERLDMIMGYKKKSRFVFCITAILTIIMLCGFTVAGAYAATQPKVQENMKPASKDGTTDTSGVKQATSYVIECVSEKIIVKQEGSEFKVEPDPKNQSCYRIRNNINIPMGDRYYRYNKWDVIFERTDRNNVSIAYSPTVIVTIPTDIDIQELLLITNSGDIYVTNLNNIKITAESKSGDIYIADTDTEYISAETVNGNIEFKNVTSKNNIRTRSINGTVSVQDDEAFAPDKKNAEINKKIAEPYWTEAEFISFMQEQEQGYKALLSKGDITQEEFEIFISTDKDILKEIQNGTKLSRYATGSITKSSYTSYTESIIRNFEKYKPFGIVYNSELDAVFYNGERVRLFVDFKQDKEKNMDYAFDLCFYDRQKLGTLCLEAVQDSNDKVIGVRVLDDTIASELLRDLVGTSPMVDDRILTFDAILKMESNGLEARDLTKDKAPSSIKTWMAECDKQQGAFVKENKTDSGYITYIYCNQGGRYPWNMTMHDDKVCLYLFSDSKLATGDGYTLLCYTAPNRYDIRLYLDSMELKF